MCVSICRALGSRSCSQNATLEGDQEPNPTHRCRLSKTGVRYNAHICYCTYTSLLREGHEREDAPPTTWRLTAEMNLRAVKRCRRSRRNKINTMDPSTQATTYTKMKCCAVSGVSTMMGASEGERTLQTAGSARRWWWWRWKERRAGDEDVPSEAVEPLLHRRPAIQRPQ